MSELHVVSIAMSEFIPINEEIKSIMIDAGKHTILKKKIMSLLWALKYAPTEGIIAEFGAYKGGNGILFSKMRPQQEIHLFDTWTGFPNQITKDVDTQKPGGFGDVKLEDVANLLKDYKNVTLASGKFQNTLPLYEDKKFSLAFIDADIYSSTLEVLRFVKKRMVIGGVILLDDYNQPDCRGVKKAVNEELDVTELILLQSGSMVAWQNLSLTE